MAGMTQAQAHELLRGLGHMAGQLPHPQAAPRQVQMAPVSHPSPVGVTGETHAPQTAPRRQQLAPTHSPVGVTGQTRAPESASQRMTRDEEARFRQNLARNPATALARTEMGTRLAQLQQARREQPRSGAGPLGLINTLASLKVPPIVGQIASDVAVPGLGVAEHFLPGVGNATSKLASEAVSLPAQTLESLILTGGAAGELAAGKPQTAETIGSSLVNQITHPVHTFEEAPLNTALMAAGGEFAAGKGLGALMRSGRFGDAAAEAAATARPDLALYNDMGVRRMYSPDVFRKAVQKASDRAMQSKRLPPEFRQENPNQATGARLARHIKGGVIHPGEVDISVHGGEALRRGLRTDVLNAAHLAKPQHGADIVGLIAENVVRHPTFAADLTKEANRLKAVQPELTGDTLAANKAELARVEGALKDKQLLADPREAFASAERYRQILEPLERGREHVGELERSQHSRAKLFGYAQTHMGAKFSDQPYAEDVTAAQNARGELVRARERLREASEVRAKQEHARSRLVGVQQSSRARSQRVATAEEQSRLSQRTEAVVEARQVEKLAQRHLNDLRKTVRPPSRVKPRLVGPNGERLTSEAILEHMRAHGSQEPAFVSHDLGIGRRRSFFRPQMTRPGGPKARTGEAFRTGNVDRSYASLEAHLSDSANRYAAHHATDERLSQFGIGTFPSQEAAAAHAENFATSPEGQRIEGALGKLQPFPIGRERVRLTGNVQPGSLEEAQARFNVQPHREAPTAAPGTKEGKFTLLPEHVAQRLQQHADLLNPGEGKRLFQKSTNAYRNVALYTSPRWMFGLPQEYGIRVTIAGAGKGSHAFGSRLADALEEVGNSNSPEAAAARTLKGNLIRGNLYTASKELEIKRSADQFASSPLLGPAMKQLEAGGELKAGHAILRPWQGWKRFVGGGMHYLEENSRKAALGKAALRDIRTFTGKWRVTQQAFDDYLHNQVLTPSGGAHLVREVDEMMGAYQHLTPRVRSAVQTWSPFGLWWLTSMRFLRRMPIAHPLETAVLAALHNAVHPMVKQGEEEQGNATYKVGGVHANLPLGLGGATFMPTYYSPAGVAIEPIKTAEGMVAPLESEVLGAAAGVNPFTAKALSGPGPEGKVPEADRLKVIANDLLGGFVPGYRQATQLREMGGTPYDTSNLLQPETKPGTQRDLAHTLTKILAPTRFMWDTGAGRPKLTPHEIGVLEDQATRAVSQREAQQLAHGSSAAEQKAEAEAERAFMKQLAGQH